MLWRSPVCQVCRDKRKSNFHLSASLSSFYLAALFSQYYRAAKTFTQKLEDTKTAEKSSPLK